jgi:hypothetical protein
MARLQLEVSAPALDQREECRDVGGGHQRNMRACADGTLELV